MRELLCCAANPSSGPRAQRIEESGNGLSRLQPLRGEIVAVAVADDAPVGHKALVLRLRQRQALEVADQCRLLPHGQKPRLVRIAVRESGAHRWKKIALSHPPYVGRWLGGCKQPIRGCPARPLVPANAIRAAI